MSTFLKSELGVAMSGQKWHSGQFTLWQSTQPDIILFTPTQPVLAKNKKGRYQFGMSQFRQQVDGTYKITGGSAIFTLNTGIDFSAEEFARVSEEWRAEMGEKGPKNPRFIPLNVRNGSAELLINDLSGVADQAHLDKNIGTPGGYNSFLVELTELGAQEWAQGIKTKSVIPAGVKIMYEYLRMMPSVGATVRVHGTRAFEHISAELKASYNGVFYGGSAQINAAWEKMTRNGTVEITFIGGDLSPELEQMRQDLVSTFAKQAQEQLFKSLFEPAPKVEDAKAGNSGGFFGGANFAFKWKKVQESTDLNLEIRFEGWTWLKASMDADLTSLISELDNSYLNEVNTQMSAPATVLVDSDPLLENVAISWSASEGKAPESPVFGPEGGNERFTVTSQRINDVKIKWQAKVNFTPSNWPIIVTKGEGTIGNGENQVVVKPTAWVGRHMIYMFVRDGDTILDPSDTDYLVCNVSYKGPHLSAPIKASAKISPFEPLEFSYPLSPDLKGGVAKFSAFGVIGGKLVRSKTEQVINDSEEAVYILAGTDGKVDLVSQSSVFPESLSQSSLEMKLLAAAGRPVITGENGSSSSTGENSLKPSGNSSSVNGKLVGTVVAVQYSRAGNPVLVIQTANGTRHQVKLNDIEDAEPFNDKRRNVAVEIGDGNTAENIEILL
jgi:hypothetical protein